MSSQSWQTFFTFLLMLLGVLTAMSAYGAYHFGLKVQQEKDAAAEAEKKAEVAKATNVGVLETKNKVIFSAEQGIFPMLEIGHTDTQPGARIGFKPNGENALFNALKPFLKDNKIVIKVVNNSIKVSTLVRDENGNLIAELIDNEWKVNPSNSFDRNYSKDALEVKNNRGEVVLQIRLFPDKVQLAGVFWGADGEGITIEQRSNESEWACIKLLGKGTPYDAIKPIFKYPSGLHLGEFLSKP